MSCISFTACRIRFYVYIILIGMCFFFFRDMTIACALRWGVASVRVYSIRHCLPRHGTPFQVQGVCKETALTRGCHCEESRVVDLVLTFVKYIRTNCFDICFYVKSIVLKLIRTMVL